MDLVPVMAPLRATDPIGDPGVAIRVPEVRHQVPANPRADDHPINSSQRRRCPVPEAWCLLSAMAHHRRQLAVNARHLPCFAAIR